MKLILIRHGEPDYSNLKIERLTQKGVQTVKKTADELKNRHIDIILTSPVPRAVLTAKIISEKLNVPMIIEDDLHEWKCEFGPHDNDVESFKAMFAEFIKHEGKPCEECHYYWEDIDILGSRIFRVLRKYNDEKTYLVMGHKMLFGQLIDSRNMGYCDYYEMDSLPKHWNGFVKAFSREADSDE